jgi:hypothetical protein
VLEPALTERTVSLPAPARLLMATPLLRDVPARLIAQGSGRPQVKSPALAEPGSWAGRLSQAQPGGR